MYGGEYGSFDASWRPRPALWRLALVSFCFLILGATIANGIVSIADAALIPNKYEHPYAIYVAPWSTLPVPPQGLNAALLAVALVLVWLWPSRATVASRLWPIALGQTLAAFGGANVPLKDWWIAAPAVAALLCMLGEWHANNLLGGHLDLDTPLRRTGVWAVRILPGAAAIGAASYVAHYAFGWMAAAGLALATLFANLVRKPGRLLETMREVQLREAAAAMPFATAVIVIAIVLTFGYTPPRALLLSAKGVQRSDTGAAVKQLEQPKPVIDIHWSRRPKSRARHE
jgi:hypothetical protein